MRAAAALTTGLPLWFLLTIWFADRVPVCSCHVFSAQPAPCHVPVCLYTRAYDIAYTEKSEITSSLSLCFGVSGGTGTSPPELSLAEACAWSLPVLSEGQSSHPIPSPAHSQTPELRISGVPPGHHSVLQRPVLSSPGWSRLTHLVHLSLDWKCGPVKRRKPSTAGLLRGLCLGLTASLALRRLRRCCCGPKGRGRAGGRRRAFLHTSPR